MKLNYLKTWLALSALCPLLAFGSDLHQHVHGDTKAEKNQSYQKPGARVEFSHNYDGETSPGDVESLSLSFREAYDAGTLTVTIKPEEGISLSGKDESYFSLNGDDEKVVEIDLLAETQGRSRLNIFVEALSPEGTIERRVFAISINISSDTQSTSLAKQTSALSKTSASAPVVVLPAHEVIKSQP